MNVAHRMGADVQKLFGKYRGKVLDNVDPLFLGRILAEVAAVQGMTMNWCMPCVPYAGAEVGFYAIPPIGANVWIEFEGGDVNYPIWTGCFWGEGEVPVVTPEPPNPMVKVFKTEFATLIMNDTPEVGGITLQCNPAAVATPLSMVFNSLGITISAAPAIIKMITEEGITLLYPPDMIAMTEETIEVTVPPSTLTMTSEMLATEAPAIETLAEGEVSIDAGGAASVKAGGALNLAAGGAVAVEATGDVNLAAVAAVSIEAAANVQVDSATILLNGITEVDGTLTIDGMVPLMI